MKSKKQKIRYKHKYTKKRWLKRKIWFANDANYRKNKCIICKKKLSKKAIKLTKHFNWACSDECMGIFVFKIKDDEPNFKNKFKK